MGNSEPRPRHWLPRQWPRDTRQWATLVLLLVVAVALWRVSRVFLLFFGAALFALFLNGLSGWVRRHTPLSRGWAVGLVLLTLAVLGSAAGWFLAPSVEHHLVRLGSELPQAFADLEQRIRASSLGKELYAAIPDLDGVIGKFSKQLSTATGTTFGVLVDLFVLFFVGLYLAINPDRYVHGFLRLFPAERRQQLEQVASVLAITLQRWVTGRLILMVSNGMVTAFGLWLMGMRLPVTLGIFSGLLNFVPNLGPFIAAIAAVLLAFVQGPWMALYVALFYLGYQMLDGYVLTPLVQRQTVALPPALTIMSQVLLGVLFGTFGVLFAVPIVACTLVLVKMLYVRDVLGEAVDLPQHPEERKDRPRQPA